MRIGGLGVAPPARASSEVEVQPLASRCKYQTEWGIQWFQTRWHNPQDVFLVGVYINHLWGIVPSTLKPLYLSSCGGRNAGSISVPEMFSDSGTLPVNHQNIPNHPDHLFEKGV